MVSAAVFSVVTDVETEVSEGFVSEVSLSDCVSETLSSAEVSASVCLLAASPAETVSLSELVSVGLLVVSDTSELLMLLTADE